MKKKRTGRLVLSKETLRALDSNLRHIVGGATNVTACISRDLEGHCTTWGASECGDCTSVNASYCSCPGGWCPEPE
jgi:hypothetical protein